MSVAVVDAYSTGAALSSMLKGLDIECFHVASLEGRVGSFRTSYISSAFAEEISMDSGFPCVLEWLRRKGVSHVVPGTETGVKVSHSLSAALGLPVNRMSPDVYRNKVLMARAAESAGVTVGASAVVRSTGDLRDFDAVFKRGKRVVVKPVASAGSDGVAFCESMERLVATVGSLLGSFDLYNQVVEACIVQEFLDGPEFYVNTVTVDGVHHVAEAWQYYKRESGDGSPIYDFEEPVDLTSSFGSNLCKFVKRCLDALGIRWYAAHTEVFYCNDRFVLGECGARLGGATAPDVIKKICGESQTHMLASYLSGVRIGQHGWPVKLCENAVRNTALIIGEFIVNESGNWDDWLRELPTVVKVSGSPKQGGLRSPTTDLLSSPGYVIQYGHKDAIAHDYQRIRAEEGRGLYGERGTPESRLT